MIQRAPAISEETITSLKETSREKAALVTRPGVASGITMRRATRIGLAPRLAAAASSTGSMRSKVEYMMRTV